MADPTPKHILYKLCMDALQKDPFQTACTLLRIQGMTNGAWDPLEESRSTISHYGELATAETKDPIKKMRLGLCLYCHVTEMDAPYELISNWLRILEGKPFRSFPFEDIVNKSGAPPFVSQKLERIALQCKATNRSEVINFLEEIIDHQVRNSFYHSDYILTPEEFRYTGKLGKMRLQTKMKLEEVLAVVERGLELFAQFISVYDSAKLTLGKAPPEHPMSDGSKLVLLSNDQVGLTGFRIERPGKSPAIFERTSNGTVCQNIELGGDGLTIVG